MVGGGSGTQTVNLGFGGAGGAERRGIQCLSFGLGGGGGESEGGAGSFVLLFLEAGRYTLKVQMDDFLL